MDILHYVFLKSKMSLVYLMPRAIHEITGKIGVLLVRTCVCAKKTKFLDKYPIFVYNSVEFIAIVCYNTIT